MRASSRPAGAKPSRHHSSSKATAAGAAAAAVSPPARAELTQRDGSGDVVSAATTAVRRDGWHDTCKGERLLKEKADLIVYLKGELEKGNSTGSGTKTFRGIPCSLHGGHPHLLAARLCRCEPQHLH